MASHLPNTPSPGPKKKAKKKKRKKQLKALRFAVGDRVLCKGGPGDEPWIPATITSLMWRSEDMEPGMVAPYQIKTDQGDILSAPADDNDLVRKAPAESENSSDNKRQRT